MKEENLEDVFKGKLEEFYGEFKPIVSKFGITSFGNIASDLCISSSQFSKLNSGSATQGMYIRSIRNVNQLIEHKNLTKDAKQLKKETKQLKKELHKANVKTIVKPKRVRMLVLLMMALFCGLMVGYFASGQNSNENKPLVSTKNNHPLHSFFNNVDHKVTDLGFLNEDEVQDYCPSSGFEGKWKLAQPYKIPLPGSKKPGVYLLAKSADITMVSSKFSTNKGQVLLGFEHLTHEIWVDKKRELLIPKYFNAKEKMFTQSYHKLDFEEDDNFVRIAELKSFYLDEFTIKPDSIIRKGQPSGRYIDFIDIALAKKYDIDVEYILSEVISDLTQTKCNSTINEYCNPNDLKVNSTISFDCIYSINMENLGLGGGYPYTKTIQLVTQNYADNLVCDCEN